MSSITNALLRATPGTLLASGSRSASANGTGIDVSLLDGHGIVLLDISNVSGTNPTADVKLQECDTVGGTYSDIAGATFTQQTSSRTLQKLALEIQQTKKFVRAVLTLGGTNPVYDCACYLLGESKY